ncbi:MAG: Ig-like domain-containing protein [Prevotella sp.]|nr:Ig-like domain-containing protein [Prevotella sp.]
MKKLLLFTWMMMLSIVAMAQTIMVIDKDGNRIPYDPAKVSSVDFQVSPPGFTVNHEVGSDLYLFDKVQSVKGLPDYLFVDPKVVHVSLASAEGYEAMFAAEVKTNIDYEVETSDPWIKVARKEADRQVCNVSKHEGNERKGYVALASKDGLLTDTIKVSIDDEFFVLKCLTPVQSITTVGTAQFMLIEIVNGALRPAAGKTISFTPENGTCSVKEAVTDAKGMVSVDFTPSSEYSDRGSVQASFRGYVNGVSMMYTSTALFAVEKFELRCQPKQYFWKDEAVTVEFQLMEYDKGTWNPVRATDINFTCENGTLNAQSKQTDEEGKVTVDFAPDKNFKKGSVTASCKVQLIGGSYWFGTATTEVIKGEEYMLEALTPYVNLCGDNLGEIPVQFRLLKYDFEKYEWEPCFDKLVEFNVENGTLSNMLDFTEIDGVATITFKPNQNFVEGSVTAFCNMNLPDGNEWHGEAVTKFMTDLYKIERILPWNADAVDYYIGKPWDCEFQLLKKEGNGYVPCPYQYIQFEATNGSCTPDYALTDAEGKVQDTYTMDDDKDNGSLKASFSFTDAEGNVCIGSVTTNFFLDKYDLKCLTPEVEVKQSETVEIRFQLFEYKGRGKWEPCPDKTITFTAKNGICTPEWTKTNAEGIATVRFSPTSTDVTEGVVQAECGITLDPKTGLEWRAAELALITITESYKLECLTKEVEIKKGETADIRFRLMEFEEGKWVTCTGVVNFTAENGTSNPEWMQADDDGLTHATFIPAADATEGTLTGSISIIINDKAKMTWSDVAHITIIDGGGGGGEGPGGGEGEIKDEDLKKADKLDDNTYVVDEKKVTIGSNEEDYVYYYYKTDPESDKSVVCIEFCKEHPVYYTVGGGVVHVTPDMIDKEVDMLKVQVDGMAWMNLFTLKDINSGYNSETNPETSVSTGNAESNAKLEKAVCKVSKDKDGGYTALMYFKTKDGMEAYAKMKAKVVAPWATN